MKQLYFSILFIWINVLEIPVGIAQNGNSTKAASIDWSIEISNMILNTKTPTTVGKWQYEDGLFLEGMLRVYKRTGDQRYLQFITSWAQLHITADGTIDQPLTSLDNMMAGFMILHLYKETGIASFKLAADKIRAAFNTYPRTTDSCFWHAFDLQNELWLDGLYMGMPFLATYGEYLNDAGYAYQEVIRQFTRHINHLQDINTNLLVHAYDADGSEPWALPPLNRTPVKWGRAIGWTVMGLSEVLDILPATFPQRNQMLAQYVSVLKALVSYQDPTTGLWFQVIDHGTDPLNWRETSCSVMFVYALKRAIQRGFLDATTYSKYVDLGYKGILTQISETAPAQVNLINISEGTSVSADINYYYGRAKNTNDLHGLGSFLIMNELLAYNNLPFRPDSSSALPLPWKSTDIGSVTPAGSASVSSNTFTLKGSGADIWTTADAFQYVYQPLSGDGNIVARILSLTNTNSWAKAGVMIRESLTPGSVFASSLMKPLYGTTPIYRNATDAAALDAPGVSASFPCWLKIERLGNVFNAYSSTNGTVWTKNASFTFTMNTNAYIGLCVTSHNNGTLTTAVFDNILVTKSNAVPVNVALNKPATSSSVETSALTANLVNDGNTGTRWSSSFSDPQSVSIDLQANYSISSVVLRWETASAKNYTLQVSPDNSSWTTVKTVTNSAGGTETWSLSGVSGRYIRMVGTARNTVWGYSLWEFEVYGSLAKSSPEEELPNSSTTYIATLIYPNPFTNDITVVTDENLPYEILTIIDLTGKKIVVHHINPAQHTFIEHLDNLPKGIYLLKLEGSVRTETFRILKN